MDISPTISLGDISVLGGLAIAAIVNYTTSIGRIKDVDYKVEELRRGRGLILKEWPVKVQKCFGYINGGHRSDPD